MDHLVVRIPLPEDAMRRAKLIVATEAPIAEMSEATGLDLNATIEREPRTRKPREPKSSVPEGQTDLEEHIAASLPHAEPEVAPEDGGYPDNQPPATGEPEQAETDQASGLPVAEAAKSSHRGRKAA